MAISGYTDGRWSHLDLVARMVDDGGAQGSNLVSTRGLPRIEAILAGRHEAWHVALEAVKGRWGRLETSQPLRGEFNYRR
jgi:hypothetical protein